MHEIQTWCKLLDDPVTGKPGRWFTIARHNEGLDGGLERCIEGCGRILDKSFGNRLSGPLLDSEVRIVQVNAKGHIRKAFDAFGNVQIATATPFELAKAA